VSGEINTSWLEPPELLESSTSFEGKPVFQQPEARPAAPVMKRRILPNARPEPSSVLNSLTNSPQKKSRLFLKGCPAQALPKIEEIHRPTLRRQWKGIKKMATERKKDASARTLEQYAQADLPGMRNVAMNFFPASRGLGGSKSARKLPSM